MNIDDYKNKVIELFQSGNATDEQWQELGEAILKVSETWNNIITKIDDEIDPIPTNMCPTCYCINIDHAPICEGCGQEL